MGYEIDFIPVGNGEHSGDAIAIRYGNLFGTRKEQKVVIIDGGFQDSGKLIVDHVNKYYNTDFVDLVISTHPDNDHSNGIEVILESIGVGELWMHLPWNHTEDIANMFIDGRVTDNSVRTSLKKSLETAYNIEKIARRKSIPITEPFFGTHFDNYSIRVLSPTSDYYDSLLPFFRGTPEPIAGLASRIFTELKEEVKRVIEDLSIETLDESGVTTAENNSSAVILFRFDNTNMLFTGDAGIPPLYGTIEFLKALEIDPSSITFLQIPHHGSKRNVSPKILDSLIGPKGSNNLNKTIFISVPKGGSVKHPAKKVTNACIRRGAKVYTNIDGNTIHHRKDAPDRAGWINLETHPFFTEVEE